MRACGLRRNGGPAGAKGRRTVWLSLALMGWMLAATGGRDRAVAATSQTLDVEATLAAATTALNQGQWEAARQGYESVLAAGHVNGHVYYNLGMAHFREQRLGEAMAALLTARRLLPRDPDVRANLRLVLSRVPDRLDAEVAPPGLLGMLHQVVKSVTTQELLLTITIAICLIGFFYFVTTITPRFKPYRRIPLIAASLPLLLLLLGIFKIQNEPVWGAALGKPKVGAHAGPGANHPVLFELHSGAPVRILERGEAGYLKVALSDGKTGWIAGSEVKVYGPPFGELF